MLVRVRRLDDRTLTPLDVRYTLPEIRRLLISLVQACSPEPQSVWPGPAGVADASTRPGYVTTGNAVDA